jgi:hypothetical protein
MDDFLLISKNFTHFHFTTLFKQNSRNWTKPQWTDHRRHRYSRVKTFHRSSNIAAKQPEEKLWPHREASKLHSNSKQPVHRIFWKTIQVQPLYVSELNFEDIHLYECQWTKFWRYPFIRVQWTKFWRYPFICVQWTKFWRYPFILIF